MLEPELEEALKNATDAEMCDIAGQKIPISVTIKCTWSSSIVNEVFDRRLNDRTLAPGDVSILYFPRVATIVGQLTLHTSLRSF